MHTFLYTHLAMVALEADDVRPTFAFACDDITRLLGCTRWMAHASCNVEKIKYKNK